MNLLDFDTELQLMKSSSYEEFVVNKDLYGFHNKRFNQHQTLELIAGMIAQQRNSKLVCRLIEEDKHFTIGDFVRNKMLTTYACSSHVKYMKNNYNNVMQSINLFFPPS